VRRAALALLIAGLVAGCGGSGDHHPGPPSNRAVIAAWLQALNAHDYAKAASFFARGAIVDQGRALRLPNRAAAIAFNRSLPCRGTLTAVKDEGRTSLGTFDLVSGSGGPGTNCEGFARVRFTIERGRFKQWRQLLPLRAPRGSEA
jgi:hypothetical protein